MISNMNSIKKIAGLICVMMLVLSISCSDDDKYIIDLDALNAANGAYLRQISISSGTFTYNSVDEFFDVANSKFEITLEAFDKDNGGYFSEVNFYVSFKDNNDENGTISKPEVKVKTIPASAFSKDATSGLPRAKILITAQEALTALGIASGDVLGADAFVFRQDIVLPDGKVFTSTNTSGDVAGGAFYTTPFMNTVSVVCPSDLGGEVQYETIVTGVGDGGDINGCAGGVSGTVTFDDQGEGKYEISDITFGQYDCAWGDTPAVGVTLNDACGLLFLSGSDQYGLVYTLTIVSNDGTTLTINWENDYGDKGTTKLTRAGGWPLNLTN